MLKKQFVMMTLVAMALQFTVVKVASAAESNFGDVVINEIAWAGTLDSSNDEWIELFNNTNTDIDLSGWSIEDDGSTEYIIENGIIPAKGYFIIEDNESAIESIKSDAVIGLSLANSGDSLVLKNTHGLLIDEVNPTGTSWPAGELNSKSSMERVDPELHNEENWKSATESNENIGRNGTLIVATPNQINSSYAGNASSIEFHPNEIKATKDEIVNFSVKISNIDKLYAYGFEINYPDSDLELIEVSESSLMSEKSAFNAALKNGEKGKLLVGNASLDDEIEVNEEDELLNLSFRVLSSEEKNLKLNFDQNAFISNKSGDIFTNFKTAKIEVLKENELIGSVKNLSGKLGEDRLSILLNWEDENSSSDYYLIKKVMPNGDLRLIAETTEKEFLDNDNLLPNINYTYKIIAVKNEKQSNEVTIEFKDERGISGDTDKNDVIDGRDVENLARAYGSNYGDDNYNMLVDSNYDGRIDGSDLINIGSNFALTY